MSRSMKTINEPAELALFVLAILGQHHVSESWSLLYFVSATNEKACHNQPGLLASIRKSQLTHHLWRVVKNWRCFQTDLEYRNRQSNGRSHTSLGIKVLADMLAQVDHLSRVCGFDMRLKMFLYVPNRLQRPWRGFLDQCDWPPSSLNTAALAVAGNRCCHSQWQEKRLRRLVAYLPSGLDCCNPSHNGGTLESCRQGDTMVGTTSHAVTGDAEESLTWDFVFGSILSRSA